MMMTFYVLHSPYPDGTWRGWEKCMGAHAPEAVAAPICGTLVFWSRDEAEQVRLDMGDDGNCWKVWPIRIDVPDVRSLPSLPVEE